MTEKELKRLSKLEIIDILIAQDEEIEELQKKIENLEDQLRRSNAVIDKVLYPAGLTESPSESMGGQSDGTD